MVDDMIGLYEVRLKIGDQWFYRGNRSPSWFYVASRADGSCQGGISERVHGEWYEVLNRVADLERAMKAIEQVLDGRQPIDIPGALMVVRSAMASHIQCDAQEER